MGEALVFSLLVPTLPPWMGKSCDTERWWNIPLPFLTRARDPPTALGVRGRGGLSFPHPVTESPARTQVLDLPSREPAPCLKSLHQAICPSQTCNLPSTMKPTSRHCWEGGPGTLAGGGHPPTLQPLALPERHSLGKIPSSSSLQAVQHLSLPALGVAWASVPHSNWTTYLSLMVGLRAGTHL